MDDLSHSAVLAVDMINDFITGKFGNKSAENAAKLAETVLGNELKIPVIFACDAHIKNDPEFNVWGEHAIDNTYGSEIYNDLKKFPDYIIKKRHFDAFYGTDLDSLLRALKINNLYIFGISTDICVLHSCAGAFYRYYNASVISDLCASINDINHNVALNNIKINYGYRIINSKKFMEEALNE